MSTTITPPGRPARSRADQRGGHVDLAKPTGTERTAVRTGAAVPRGTRRKKVAKRSQPKRSLIGRVKLLVQVIMRRQGIAHLILAAKRFSERLGNQFAAAITYFTILSLVPMLMVAFAAAGFVLASRPDLLTQLQNSIAAQIPGGGGVGGTIGTVLQTAVDKRAAVGIVGLLTALYSGIGWAGNIRAAVQAQWRPDFDDDQEMLQETFIKKLVKNLGLLVSLGLALIVSLALSAVGVALSSKILDWLGLSHIAILKPVFAVVPILIAIAADVFIFAWVYTALPPSEQRASRTALLRGALMAAVGFEALKFALTFFLPKVVNNAAGAAFGPIIGLLFFFNLVATVVLFVAAWIATSPGGNGDPDRKKPDSAAGAVPPPAVVVGESVSRPKAIGFVGVGTILGLGLAARRRR